MKCETHLEWLASSPPANYQSQLLDWDVDRKWSMLLQLHRQSLASDMFKDWFRSIVSEQPLCFSGLKSVSKIHSSQAASLALKDHSKKRKISEMALPGHDIHSCHQTASVTTGGPLTISSQILIGYINRVRVEKPKDVTKLPLEVILHILRGFKCHLMLKLHKQEVNLAIHDLHFCLGEWLLHDNWVFNDSKQL